MGSQLDTRGKRGDGETSTKEHAESRRLRIASASEFKQG